MNGHSPRRYTVLEPSAAEAFYEMITVQIDVCLATADTVSAQQTALYWADCISHRLGLEPTQVWKHFKRNLAERWFGRVERRLFTAGWSVDDVLSYSAQFPGRNVRISFFAPNIACHAKSVRIPTCTEDTRRAFVRGLPNSCPIEVFPETCGSDTVCFRRFTTQFGDDVVYETAHGQAMNVFENEQGRHILARAIKTKTGYTFTPPGSTGCNTLRHLTRTLENLIGHHEIALSFQCFGLCRTVGIEYLSIEGYFNERLNHIVVVDLDLPLDFVFMNLNRR